ncbi:hypothetical protein [Guyparkeria sp.]|uniref:hypothetical protein n=1 Tax=Guyparkeria sp. TaxID=2035736 RepID=UPI003970BD0E
MTTFHVAHDKTQTDGSRAIASPISPAFMSESEARKALAEIAPSIPGAYLVARRTLR